MRLFPPGPRCPGGEQGGLEPADHRLPGLGRGIRPQSWHHDRVGREGRAQGGLCSARATQDGAKERLRRLLHLQEHGAGPSYRITMPKFPTADPNYRILARQKSRFTHNYFYIRDEVLGPMVMRVATFFPFQTTYYLNGHNFIEQELNRKKITFRKNDNAFLAVDDVGALQGAADKLSPAIIRE